MQSLAEIQRDREHDRRGDGDPARDAAGSKNWRFVGHERGILKRLGEVGEEVGEVGRKFGRLEEAWGG
jgi:hypothetical protein